MTNQERLRNRISGLTKELEQQVKETAIIVALLGSSGLGLQQRRLLAHALSTMGIVAIVPEDDFPKELAPSLIEKSMFSKGDVELIFVNVDSWGSLTEFAQFHAHKKIAPKLRVLINHLFHPLYGTCAGYLTDLYLTHEAVFGHTYAVDDNSGSFPSSKTIVTKLAERYKEWKSLS